MSFDYYNNNSEQNRMPPTYEFDQPASMGEVENEQLNVTILSNGEMLSPELWTQIKEKLSAMVSEYVHLDGGSLLGFDSTQSVCGYRVVRCANLFSLNFLEHSIANINNVWVGIMLSLLPENRIPGRLSACIYLPKINIDGEKLLKCLKILNPNFPLHNWSVIRANEPTEFSHTFQLLIDEESLEQLRMNEYSLRFGITHAKVVPDENDDLNLRNEDIDRRNFHTEETRSRSQSMEPPQWTDYPNEFESTNEENRTRNPYQTDDRLCQDDSRMNEQNSSDYRLPYEEVMATPTHTDREDYRSIDRLKDLELRSGSNERPKKLPMDNRMSTRSGLRLSRTHQRKKIASRRSSSEEFRWLQKTLANEETRYVKPKPKKSNPNPNMNRNLRCLSDAEVINDFDLSAEEIERSEQKLSGARAKKKHFLINLGYHPKHARMISVKSMIDIQEKLQNPGRTSLEEGPRAENLEDIIPTASPSATIYK